MRSTKQQARVAGLLYLFLALSAPIGLVYVPAKVIVSGNATATADNIRASEGLIRIGIASELIHQVLIIARAAYLASSFVTLVLPRFAPLVSQVALPLEIAEVPIVLWLLIWGAKTRPIDAPAG